MNKMEEKKMAEVVKMCGRNGDKYEVKKSNVNCRSNGNGGGFYRLW